MVPLTDKRLLSLIASVKAGNEDAANALFTYCRHILSGGPIDVGNGLSSKVSSSDIIQQSLFDVYKHLHTFRGRTVAQFRLWVQEVATNNFRDTNRRYRQTQRRDVSREVPLLEPVAGPDRTPSSYVRKGEADLALWDALQQLPASDQTIIELRHRDKLSHAEIGRKLGISTELARQRLSRCIKLLQRKLASN